MKTVYSYGSFTHGKYSQIIVTKMESDNKAEYQKNSHDFYAEVCRFTRPKIYRRVLYRIDYVCREECM